MSGHAATLRQAGRDGLPRSGPARHHATAQRVVEAAGDDVDRTRRWGGDADRGPSRDSCAVCSPAGPCATRRCSSPRRRSARSRATSRWPASRRWATDLASQGHTFIDFGDDQLTVGRPHPMIEPGLRNERLARELADDDCAVVLLDVVLGLGSHADPATELAAVIADATKPVDRSRSWAPATTPRASTHRRSDWPRPARSCMPPTPPRPARPSPWSRRRSDEHRDRRHRRRRAARRGAARARRHHRGRRLDAPGRRHGARAHDRHARPAPRRGERRGGTPDDGRPGCPGRRPARVRSTRAPTR